ncbi:MAG: cytochrome ubiquinol oxidase subunit I [Deltaproteobacteria bacterium]|nr:cytochrome ubiquinol oxidase subunit I [Deltaproteobacteria bacterium]
MMDVLMLSRLQFAAAAFYHFLFVPLTLGLSVMVALMETKYARTGDETYLRMTRFWGKVFLINFVMGIVTGITLEFQFGTNWSRYSEFMGDIFGSLLAIEALGFFFLESTMIGVWIFGWKKLSRKAHAFVMWLVAFASTGSAVWILTANSWMQHPVGYVIRNNRAELADFFAVASNPYAILMFFHVIAAAYLLSSFFVMGVSAYHLLRKKNLEFFTRSFRMALTFGLVVSVFLVIEGHYHAADLAHTQPAKLAAMESHWKTESNAPMYMLVWPDADNEGNSVEALPIPGFLSWMAFHDSKAEVKGLMDFPRDERPPVAPTFFSFKIMAFLGFYFVLLMVVGWLKRNRLTESPGYLKLMLYSMFLPYVAIELGWMVAEIGRQPWLVYGLMKTSDAVSHISVSQAAGTLIGFIVIYSLLACAAGYLLVRFIKAGPQPKTA